MEELSVDKIDKTIANIALILHKSIGLPWDHKGDTENRRYLHVRYQFIRQVSWLYTCWGCSWSSKLSSSPGKSAQVKLKIGCNLEKVVGLLGFGATNNRWEFDNRYNHLCSHSFSKNCFRKHPKVFDFLIGLRDRFFLTLLITDHSN